MEIHIRYLFTVCECMNRSKLSAARIPNLSLTCQIINPIYYFFVIMTILVLFVLSGDTHKHSFWRRNSLDQVPIHRALGENDGGNCISMDPVTSLDIIGIVLLYPVTGGLDPES